MNEPNFPYSREDPIIVKADLLIEDIHSINGKSVCDYFIRYEYLEEDIKTLCKKLKIYSCDISLLPKHKSGIRKSKKHWSEYYDDETKKIVYNKHKKEFELFGYDSLL